MINLENTHPHPTKEKLLFIKIRPKKYFLSTVSCFLPPLRSPIQFQNKSNLIFILWVLYLLSVWGLLEEGVRGGQLPDLS